MPMRSAWAHCTGRIAGLALPLTDVKMKTNMKWQRLEYDGQPVYVEPERPDWFVPSGKADLYLQALLASKSADAAACRLADRAEASMTERVFELARLGSRLAAAPSPPYEGRAAQLELQTLKECWFHLTDTCNLACRHCLFSASPAASQTISPALLRQGLAEARRLGCALFYFTGGEPFVYDGFLDIVKDLLADPAVHAVVLTNGMLIEESLAALKTLPRERLHLQISMDGLTENHEKLRGTGTFARLLKSLAALRGARIPATVSVAVNRANIADLPAMIAFAADQQVKNVHLLWHFVRGKGTGAQFVPPAEILPQLLEAQGIAEQRGVLIDNIETLKSQVFSTPGTRHDLSNTAWESLAVGPDGHVYPSPALVGIEALDCGPLADGLEQVWRTSPVLDRIRSASLIDHAAYRDNPLKFVVGGGDIDHSYIAGGEFAGHDPYVALYNGIALWLIARQARQYPAREAAEILLRMGDVRYDCPDGGMAVSLTHCNCVISLSDDRGHSSVRDFYGRAALAANEDIVNPFAPQQEKADFIPEESKKKSYGCGSPVNDAGVRPGEVLVDLGSGSGVECFMAADAVGAAGRVIGIDMTDEMLALARSSKDAVVQRLGYDNVEFCKGFLEDIPLPDASADVVISNCVINLSPDKRRTFHEVYRILKAGGRMVVSDIITDHPIPVEIKNNEKFRGECLGGALQQEDLIAMLRAAGFVGIRLLKRFFYRQEGDTSFYSLTFAAHKPEPGRPVEIIYRGPFGGVYTQDGVLLLKGQRASVSLEEANSLDESVFVLDQGGGVANIDMGSGCCDLPAATSVVPIHSLAPLPAAAGCCGAPSSSEEGAAAKIVTLPSVAGVREPGRHRAGCMVCGGELSYLSREQEAACHYCGGVKKTNAICGNGHFICDDCHQQDALSVIKLLCLEAQEEDMLALLKRIRRHPKVPMHGPEHHAMVPGIILATYRNRGGKIGRETILSGIERGSKVPGGVCGFWGNCGAATGAGIAYSVMLDATPLTPRARQQAMQVTARVLAKIAATAAGRCCQRETVTALREAARLSGEMLPVSLLAEEAVSCAQFDSNRECIRKQCPLWRDGDASSVRS